MPLNPHIADALSWSGQPRRARLAAFGELVGELQRSYVRGLLRRGGADLEVRSPALYAWLERESQTGALWKVPLPYQAALLDSVERGSGDLGWLAALIGLSLHARGERCDFSIRFCEPAHLRYGGWVSPLVRELEVQGSRVRLDATWIEPDDRASCQQAQLTALNVFGWREHQITLVSERFSALCPVPAEGRASDAELSTLLPVLAESCALLEACAPEYVSWILDAVHTVVPLRRVGGDHRSGSYNNMPGVVAIGTPLDAVTLAELLFHEASHQYLLALRTSYRLSNGLDAREYLSPFPQKMRPIEGILVGYHAFANIERMQLELAQSPRDDVAQAAHLWLRKWEKELRQCERILTASPGLTECGRRLWEPIAAELRPRGSRVTMPLIDPFVS